ncbi:MAG TPA: transcriptional regulator [Oceanospirillaceae bacterium]|nr:transcriptional regulator [Oceanospirillaceae bacterium]
MINHLKQLRGQHGWTQQDLASKLDVSRQTIIAIEKGKFDPSLPLAFKMARLFKQPIESIFIGGVDNGHAS